MPAFFTGQFVKLKQAIHDDQRPPWEFWESMWEPDDKMIGMYNVMIDTDFVYTNASAFL